MDDKIIEGLDNLDVSNADKLLDSIETTNICSDMDNKSMDRIKASVLKKAGFNKKLSKPLIQNKLMLFAGCLFITFIELVFLMTSSFVAWMDGFLTATGIDISLSGIIPFALYCIMFTRVSLLVYLIMYNLDCSTISMDNILPKNRTAIIYFFFFVFSAASRVLALMVLLFITYYASGLIGALLVLALFLTVFSLLDMLTTNLKNRILSHFQGTLPSPRIRQLDIKCFLLELLKYGVMTIFIIILSIFGFTTRISGMGGIASLILGFVVLLIINVFLTFVVLLKKRHYRYISLSCDTAKYIKKESAASEVKPLNPRIYLKKNAVAFGASALALLYAFCFMIPYIARSGLKPEKPTLSSFSNRNDATAFFTDNTLPFNVKNFQSKSISDFTELTFMLNKALLNLLSLKPNELSLPIYLSSAVKSDMNAGFESGKLTNNDFSGEQHSTTNTQVENVDEADVIKTDGKYVYYINQSKLHIVKAAPPEQMKIIYQHDFSEEGLFPSELFLYNNHLAVILTNNGENYGITKYRYDASNTIVRTYNIEDPSNPVQERSFELGHSYLTSRMVNNNLYLVTDSYLRYNHVTQEHPDYIDSATSASLNEIDYSNIYFMQNGTNRDYNKIIVIAAFPVDNAGREAQVKAYIGGVGENVYVSAGNIYIVESVSNAIAQASVYDFFNTLTDIDSDVPEYHKYGTSIYRISIQDGIIGDFDSSFVPGRVHNQFSMDEYNGYFRLTTQTGQWRCASSNVYVLDGNMEMCGALEGLAPEENIFASRFMGDRLYLVTFKVVDPLFVIDMKNPRKPSVLGELKIPGYSEYIHPLDENHIIGFGKDTAGGNENFSWYQGIKMAIFDVTDVKNPKEKLVEIIGDRGSDSELLRNHKALMFMKDLELMAFPVTVAENYEGARDSSHGNIVYQGAYVYNISSTEGFSLRGKITHIDGNSDLYDETAFTSFINRIIYANKSLYTFSANKVKATKYSDMQNVSEIILD